MNQKTDDDDIFIGRQGIYDAEQRIYGYELLYRDGSTNRANFSDGNLASSQVLLNSFLEFGMERIVGPYRAFINLTRQFFIDQSPLPFATDQVVLEVLEDIDIDQPLIDAVAAAHKQGFALALDDFAFEPRWQPLLPYASIIKVEIPALDWDSAASKVAALRRPGVSLLAEKVETAEEFDRLRELGFDYFQGYFFSRPRVMSARKISENNLVVLRLLARLNDPDTGIDELKQLIEQDPGLSYKILRYINSAAVGLSRRVDSLHQSVVYMGLARIRALASLMVMSSITGRPSDLLHNALLRAHFCQQLAADQDPDKAFTVGMLSILDLLIDAPLDELLPELPLAQDVVNALRDHSGPLGEALHCVLAVEHHQWSEASYRDLSLRQLNDAYLSASEAAYQAISALSD